MSKIYFREIGSGPALVFLHGFCDTHELWNEFVDIFSKSYRVFTPDLPGFGRSPMLSPPFTVDEVGDELVRWMHQHDIVEPIVIGHSLGGYVALSLLARHSDKLSGIALFHSTPFGDSDERKKTREKVIQFVEQNGVEPFIETFVPGLFADKLDSHIETTRQRAINTKKEALINYAVAMRNRLDRSDAMQQTTLPVLVIAGALDPLIPIDDLRKFVKIGQKRMFYELPKAAHMGIFEAKTSCQGIISEFVTSALRN